jgi:hypothetical protein
VVCIPHCSGEHIRCLMVRFPSSQDEREGIPLRHWKWRLVLPSQPVLQTMISLKAAGGSLELGMRLPWCLRDEASTQTSCFSCSSCVVGVRYVVSGLHLVTISAVRGFINLKLGTCAFCLKNLSTLQCRRPYTAQGSLCILLYLGHIILPANLYSR